jgi:hypothetical protein
MGVKKIEDLTADELKVFEMIKQTLVKDAPPLVFNNTGDLRDVINGAEEQEKNKYAGFQKQADTMKQLLRQIEEGFYKNKGGK